MLIFYTPKTVSSERIFQFIFYVNTGNDSHLGDYMKLTLLSTISNYVEGLERF